MSKNETKNETYNVMVLSSIADTAPHKIMPCSGQRAILLKNTCF